MVGFKDAKAPHQWSPADVTSWLEKIGLGSLAPRFKENAVNGEDLQSLTDQEITGELGVAPLQLRKLRSELGKLGAAGAPPAPVVAKAAAVPFAPAPPAYSTPPPAPPAYGTPLARAPSSAAPSSPALSPQPSLAAAASLNPGIGDVVSEPVQGMPLRPPSTPVRPGQEIVGYQICRHEKGSFKGMHKGGITSFFLLIIPSVFLAPFCCFCAIPFCMDGCYGKYQRPVYGEPGDESVKKAQ